jgi:hypothetical protein
MNMDNSIRIASVIMPIIGPRISALGEMDFIRAHMIPARRIIPFSFHNCRKEINSQTLKNDNIIPESGIFRLWRKLPRMISIDAQILPITEALSHV